MPVPRFLDEVALHHRARDARRLQKRSADHPPHPKVRQVIENSHACTVELDGGDADVQRLLRQLVAADCGLISFADKEPTLEDVS